MVILLHLTLSTLHFQVIQAEDVDHFVCTITGGEGETIDPCISPKEFTNFS